jgi:hypothetical protein
LKNTLEEKTAHRKIIKSKYTFQEEKSAHRKIIKWKYTFQEEKSAHRNNQVNLKTKNKKSAPDRCPDQYKYRTGSFHLYSQMVLLLQRALGS